MAWYDLSRKQVGRFYWWYWLWSYSVKGGWKKDSAGGRRSEEEEIWTEVEEVVWGESRGSSDLWIFGLLSFGVWCGSYQETQIKGSQGATSLLF